MFQGGLHPGTMEKLKMKEIDYKKARKHKEMEKYTNLLFLLPMLLVFLVFIIIPITEVFWDSFHSIKLNGSKTWTGLSNYKKFFQDSKSLLAFKNTIIWVFGGTLLKILLGLFMALILYKPFVGKRLLTVIMLVPYATPAAVSCMIWRLMYHPSFGHISQILKDLGILTHEVSFLGSMETSLLAVLIVNVWAVAPFCALNILTTMYSIPTYLYEAANIDGANSIQKFFKITLPLILSNTRTLALLIAIWAFNSFDVIYMMTTGGPANSSSILVNLIYQNAFEFNNRGYSSAISVVCFVMLFIFSVLYVRSKRKEEAYE